MRIEGPKTPVVIRALTTFYAWPDLEQDQKPTKSVQCACCETFYTRGSMAELEKLFEYVTEYKARDEITRRAVPPENRAAYFICVKCSRRPEDYVFARAQEHLMHPEKGDLLSSGHKPINEPGLHRKKTGPLITQDTKFDFIQGE